MATSNIAAAYAALDATNITFSLRGADRTPAVKTLSELPNIVNAADLPMRLLLSVDGVGEASDMQFLTLGQGTAGGSYTVTWRIVDLMLAATQASGSGAKDVALSLVTYCGKYMDMARNSRNLASGISIQKAVPSAGIYEFPAGSGNMFFGVQVIIDLVEIVS